MQTITTKYHGPTNNRGARITATATGGCSMTIPYPQELSGVLVHLAAARALCQKLNWHGDLSAGDTKTGYVFVFSDSDRFTI